VTEDWRLEVQVAKKLPGFDLDVSWCVGNELAVLFGYSGSGKSLSLRLVAGLMKPDSGRVVLNGEVVFDSSTGQRVPPQERNLGFVFQDLALFPHMSVLKNITYGLQHLNKEERQEGQRQRVALARALARRPKALLLDEPFSALDLPLKIELWELIAQVRESLGIPIVVVTHDPVDARNLSDRLIVYQSGRVLRNDVPNRVLHDPDAPELFTLAEAGASFAEVSEWVSGLELDHVQHD
jgi:molybdate transport system ATP-binding protein